MQSDDARELSGIIKKKPDFIQLITKTKKGKIFDESK
jgi:hypothetical protein